MLKVQAQNRREKITLQTVKIGVLSDTHKQTKLQEDAIKQLKKEGAQYLLHLGDLEIEQNLISLKNANLPYAAVFGNNDSNLYCFSSNYKIKKEPYYLKIKNLTIKMMHLPYYLSSDSDIVLYGHTHQFSAELKNSTLFLNPGEICARKKNLSQCAIIEANKDSFVVKYYFSKPHSNKWELEVKFFKRDNG